MTDDKQLPEKYSDTTRYKLLASGAVYDKQAGHVVANIGGAYTLTPETARELATLKHEQRARAGAIGTIRGAGIEIASDAPEEEVENKRLAAIENYHEKVGGLAMEAKSPRGIEGVFPTIKQALMGEPPPATVFLPGIGEGPAGILVQIRQYIMQLQAGQGSVTDGEVIDTRGGNE